MAKNSVPDIEIEIKDPEMTTLQEFCILLSGSDRRVEMIAAFNYSEQLSGRIKDTASAFRTRYNAFANKPV